MSKFIKLFLFSLIWLSLFNYTYSQTYTPSEGKKIFHNILKKYKKLDKFYYEPLLFGGATYNPKVSICLPKGEWNKLKDTEKQLLVLYLKNMIKEVKRNPVKYSNISPEAPGARLIRERAQLLNEDDWIIKEGFLTKDGIDLMNCQELVSKDNFKITLIEKK